MLHFIRLKRGYRSTRFARRQIRPFVLARFHRSKSASILISPVIKSRNGAPLRSRFGKIVCLDVTLKAVVLKTPGQTNSGVLCLLQVFLRGRFVAAPRGPMVAYFDKMSCNRCNEAPLCGFLPSVDSCRLLSGAIRR